MSARKGEMYRPYMAGPEGCITYEIFSTQDGTSLITYGIEDGGQVSMDVNRRDLRRAGQEDYAR